MQKQISFQQRVSKGVYFVIIHDNLSSPLLATQILRISYDDSDECQFDDPSH